MSSSTPDPGSPPHFLALLVTHFADLKLSHILREQIIERITHAPLAWFSAAATATAVEFADGISVVKSFGPGRTRTRTIPSEKLYRTVSFVLQDPQLLRISLRETIRLARPDADDRQIMDAAQHAHIDQEITALPAGPDTGYGSRPRRCTG